MTLACLDVRQELDEATHILETARGKFPEDPKVDVLLAHIYMKQEMNYTAAYLLEAGACKDKKYLKDAVEMHRRIKDYSHAIFLTTQMTDKVEKLKQKVAVYLDRGEFEKVIGLKGYGLEIVARGIRKTVGFVGLMKAFDKVWPEAREHKSASREWFRGIAQSFHNR